MWGSKPDYIALVFRMFWAINIILSPIRFRVSASFPRVSYFIKGNKNYYKNEYYKIGMIKEKTQKIGFFGAVGPLTKPLEQLIKKSLFS